MSPLPPDAPSLVYAQDETFVAMVGEPLPLTELSRIVVAKWDGLYAEALQRACQRAFPGIAVEGCRTGGEVLATLRRLPADFALLGLTFADMDGVDVLEAIVRERLAARVFVVSGRKDEHSLGALRAARFDGFFDPFEEGAEALVGALRQVADGRGYVSPTLARRMVNQRIDGMLARRLTPGELQVLSVVGDGSDNQEAAARLGLSEATIQMHRANLMRKLDVPTSAKLVLAAVRLGVVRVDADGRVVRPGFEQRQAARHARTPDGKSPV